MTYRSSFEPRGGGYGPAYEGTGRSGAWSGMTTSGDRTDYDYDRGARGGTPQGNYGMRSGEYGRGGFDRDWRGDQDFRGDWDRGGYGPSFYEGPPRGYGAERGGRGGYRRPFGDREFPEQPDRGDWALQSAYGGESERWGGRNVERGSERGSRSGYEPEYGPRYGSRYEWESSEQVRRGAYPEREWRGDMGYNAGAYGRRAQSELERATGSRYWRGDESRGGFGEGSYGADVYEGGRWDRRSGESRFDEGWRGSEYGSSDYLFSGEAWQPGPYTGKGPRGYQRSDDRIREDVCDRLTHHGGIDASEFDVEVQNGEVTLRGEVDDRRQKRVAEDVAESVPGVKDVRNELRVHEHPQVQAGASMRAGMQGSSAAGGASRNDKVASR